MTDSFDNLLPMKWRSLSFPISRAPIQDTQDLAVHKYPGVDGARVEAMGRNPRVITATCLFINGLIPNQYESWNSADLYPNTYNKFMELMASTETGTLQHPVFGNIICKPVAVNPNLDAQIRSGEVVEAQWIETLDKTFEEVLSGNNLLLNLLDKSLNIASALDTKLNQLTPDPATLGVKFTDKSFFSMLSELQAFPDQANVFLMKKLAFIKSINYQIQSMLNSINNLVNTTATLLNPQTYQAEILKISRGGVNTYANAVNNNATVASGVLSVGKNFNVKPPSKQVLLAQYNAYKANPQSLTPLQVQALKQQIKSTSINPITNVLIDKESLANSLLQTRIKAVTENQSNQQILAQISTYANQLSATLQLLTQNIIQTNQKTATYTVVAEISLTSLSIQLNNTVIDLMSLNPQLTAYPYVPIGSKVIYLV